MKQEMVGYGFLPGEITPTPIVTILKAIARLGAEFQARPQREVAYLIAHHYRILALHPEAASHRPLIALCLDSARQWEWIAERMKRSGNFGLRASQGKSKLS
ncbi:MAG: hypothetical protein HY694_15535 [Deltaproteobacteria bacterium]|nr:hypothetical protein [Deltaproteobacteria bacterium]